MEPNTNFAGRDVINSYDFNNQELCHIMDTAMIYEKRVKEGEAIKDLDGKVVATLFFEPSTRTRLSFQAAIARVGASCIDLGNASVSSQSKGETWQDTLKTVDGYVDAIVMRHPTSGAAIEAAEIFRENGFLAMPVRHPTVPKGTARLRLSLSASLTDDDVERLCSLIRRISGEA